MRKAKSISECFAVLVDTRTGPHTLHKLHDMLVIAFCATICGADMVNLQSAIFNLNSAVESLKSERSP